MTLLDRITKALVDNYSEHASCDEDCPHREDDSFGYMAAQILEMVADDLISPRSSQMEPPVFPPTFVTSGPSMKDVLAKMSTEGFKTCDAFHPEKTYRCVELAGHDGRHYFDGREWS